MMKGILNNYLNKIFEVLLFIGLLIFSFLLTFKAGERGLFALDQCNVFDGSYRILSGQIPYKDFLIPFGPVVFWLQAIFFKLLGISYFSYIFGAAFINVLATLGSTLILRMFFPSRRFLSYIAGLLTAVWFYPPVGTPYYEQTAFFFSLVAITVLLFATLIKKRNSVSGNLLILISSFFALLSCLSKQNAGLFILPLYPLLLIAVNLTDLRRIFINCIIFSAGFIGNLVPMFLLWVWFNSDFGLFIQYVLKVPSGFGLQRLFGDWVNLFIGLLVGKGQFLTGYLVLHLF